MYPLEEPGEGLHSWRPGEEQQSWPQNGNPLRIRRRSIDHEAFGVDMIPEDSPSPPFLQGNAILQIDGDQSSKLPLPWSQLTYNPTYGLACDYVPLPLGARTTAPKAANIPRPRSRSHRNRRPGHRSRLSSGAGSASVCLEACEASASSPHGLCPTHTDNPGLEPGHRSSRCKRHSRHTRRDLEKHVEEVRRRRTYKPKCSFLLWP